jgi:DNA polymerase III subunit epsilon
MSRRSGAIGEPELRAMRAALANLRAAAETLEAYPEMEIVRRTRLFQVLVEEAKRLSNTLATLETASRERIGEGAAPVAIAELVGLIEDRLAAAGLRVESSPIEAAPGQREVEIASAELGDELVHLTRGLESDFGIAAIRISIGVVESFARFDLGWAVPESGGDPVSSWILDRLDESAVGENGQRGLRDLVQSHGGEVWYSLDRDGRDAHLRFLLPLAPAAVSR